LPDRTSLPSPPIAGIRLAREQQVTARVVPTSKAIEESADLAHEIFNRMFRRVSEAQRRADELRTDLTTRGVHPDVLRFCKSELLADDYFHAVLEAAKSIADKLRLKSSLSDDGAKLVDVTLCGSSPRLAINDLITESQRSEQSGFANLVKGVFGMFRNPTAHEARIHWAMNKEDAEDILSIISLIHRRLDSAS
jgi:uncharacterized protein (TIGR02391 family)